MNPEDRAAVFPCLVQIPQISVLVFFGFTPLVSLLSFGYNASFFVDLHKKTMKFLRKTTKRSCNTP
jgi:hypothetical protein